MRARRMSNVMAFIGRSLSQVAEIPPGCTNTVSLARIFQPGPNRLEEWASFPFEEESALVDFCRSMRTAILFAPLSYDSDANGPRRAERVSALERVLLPLGFRVVHTMRRT